MARSWSSHGWETAVECDLALLPARCGLSGWVVIALNKDQGETVGWPRFVRTAATVNDRVGLDNQEQGLPLMLCRTTSSWPTLWPHLRHYD